MSSPATRYCHPTSRQLPRLNSYYLYCGSSYRGLLGGEAVFIFDYIFIFFCLYRHSHSQFLAGGYPHVYFYESFGWSLGRALLPSFPNASWSLAKFVDLSKHLREEFLFSQ